MNSAPVAQLDRVPGYEPGGRGFDSCLARHFSFIHAGFERVLQKTPPIDLRLEIFENGIEDFYSEKLPIFLR